MLQFIEWKTRWSRRLDANIGLFTSFIEKLLHNDEHDMRRKVFFNVKQRSLTNENWQIHSLNLPCITIFFISIEKGSYLLPL